MARLDTFLIRILNARGQPVGTGFMAAHSAGVSENQEITLDFPLLSGRKPVTAQVAFFDAEKDISGLRINSELPHGVRPARLVAVEDLANLLAIFGKYF